jgi:hypothetical protein
MNTDDTDMKVEIKKTRPCRGSEKENVRPDHDTPTILGSTDSISQNKINLA